MTCSRIPRDINRQVRCGKSDGRLCSTAASAGSTRSTWLCICCHTAGPPYCIARPCQCRVWMSQRRQWGFLARSASASAVFAPGDLIRLCADIGKHRQYVVQRRGDVRISRLQKNRVVLGMPVGGGHQPEGQLGDGKGCAVILVAASCTKPHAAFDAGTAVFFVTTLRAGAPQATGGCHSPFVVYITTNGLLLGLRPVEPRRRAVVFADRF